MYKRQVLKGGWALIMGLIMYRLLPHFKYSWLAGAVTGGIFHVIGYTLVKIPLYGGGVAMAECFTLVAQTAAGIVLGGVAYTCLLYTSPEEWSGSPSWLWPRQSRP